MSMTHTPPTIVGHMKPTDNRTGTAVTVEHLCRRFGEQHALRDVSLALAPGRVLALLGPSGCGKTTLLKLLAGLDRPGSGRILFGDNVVASETTMVPPQHRRLGMVFQDYALWPHMSVQANVAFPLEMQAVTPWLKRTGSTALTCRLLPLRSLMAAFVPCVSLVMTTTSAVCLNKLFKFK